MHVFVSVAVLDARGWVLLQERDGHAPIDPDRWGLPGGGLDAGEAPLGAAVRELREETGIVADADAMEHLGSFQFHRAACGHEDRMDLFRIRVDLEQDDIVCGEGRQMVFVDPSDFDDLELSAPARVALPVAMGCPPRRFAGVILVDARGWVLLQERDEHPRIDPETWGLVGGHVEDDEDFGTAAHRELEEETGVRLLPEQLARLAEFVVDHREPYGTWDRMQVFCARTDLTDADIECHEGRQIVFVDPGTITDLHLSHAAAAILPAFLRSDDYARMRP